MIVPKNRQITQSLLSALQKTIGLLGIHGDRPGVNKDISESGKTKIKTMHVLLKMKHLLLRNDIS